VAAVVFLCSRAVPFGGFLVTLAGGAALARAGERQGGRRGFGASLAAMLQSIAIIGPARLGVPLTQAISAPLLGRMEAAGRGTLPQVLVCSGIRLCQNSLGFLFFVGVITGLDAYAATYDRIFGGLIALPEGVVPALAVSAALLVGWAAVASTVQVLVYRRGLRAWRRDPEAGRHVGRSAVPSATPPLAEAPVEVARSRSRPFDPRALAVAAILAFGGLLASFSWPVVAAAAGWLALAWLAAARGGRDVLPTGLGLASILALGAFGFAFLGGLGLDVALRRAARAGLLVLVATWLRAAAGSDGLREVARRSLHRLRRVPAVTEASEDLDQLGATPRLAAAGRTLLASLKGVRKRPVPVLDAVLDWVHREATRFQPAPEGTRVRTGLGAADASLVVLALAPALVATVAI